MNWYIDVLCTRKKQSMKKVCVIVAVFLLMTGCASVHMNKGLTALQNESIQTAISVLGYPDSKVEVESDTVYIWSTNRSGVAYLSTYNAVPVNYNCTIKIITDSWGNIKTWEWSGSEAGCGAYGQKLLKYYKQFE